MFLLPSSLDVVSDADNEAKDPRLRSEFVVGKGIEAEVGKSVACGLSRVWE